MDRWVDITFECLPLRSIPRFDIPLDASPGFQAFCERVKAAAKKHGLHNSYYLHDGRCVFRLTNHAQMGMLGFRFEGTLLTDAGDTKTVGSDLAATLAEETCDWITGPVVQWFTETVRKAVETEFDRFIAAGDLQKTLLRMEKLQAESNAGGGFLGMGL